MALEMLESQDKFSLEDVIRLKFNTKMLLADRVKPALIQAIRDVKEPWEDLQRGLGIIEAWDNHVSATSKGAVLFQRFCDTYSQANRQPFATPWDAKRPAATPAGLSDPALAVKHLERMFTHIGKVGLTAMSIKSQCFALRSVSFLLVTTRAPM